MLKLSSTLNFFTTGLFPLLFLLPGTLYLLIGILSFCVNFNVPFLVRLP